MREELLATINDEHATVEAFASLLAYEEKALTTAEPLAMLPDIVEKKTALLDRLAQLERTRDTQLAALGFPAGKKGMDLVAERDTRLAGCWTLLQQAAERARRANANNGMLIRIRMDYNERALAVLRSAPAPAGVYGPDGRVSALMR
ncbi:flagellar protein FlgN [Burkholderia multivorans]|uniref:flagella synthesis protein FlgN n=1 Tax=Burkholderia multivorans TaxID=87883 RepID=UPI0004F6F11D|nr:flagellar protein FlgN [Burkholderia multivorans]AIO77194.1 flgN family protein [Burkholderia multivorans]AOK68823.1 flagellar biosynthesis protein FlgN [Burkholderia multivorans]KVZ73325.1 flagellar biosynthesis protein FlgN [Burkholderia multivorans]MBU9390366.1 flagellar protein FlgN [Burkholderia multivorans]